MAPLAPIVDRMRQLATEELPSRRSCKIRLYDDETFEVVIYHSMGSDERQQLRYEHTTGEILWEHFEGARYESESIGSNETLHKPVYDSYEIRVVDTFEPPYTQPE
jgi:hypothetical protein